MKTYTLVVLLTAVIVAGALWAYLTNVGRLSAPGGRIACTQEAKLCPDGSYVGREGPNCEFVACPAVQNGGGAGVGAGGRLSYDSGIRGTVVLGPTCPVVHNPPDPSCADKPYSTSVGIFSVSDKTYAVALTESANDGAFRVSLPPGEYYVRAGGGQMLPRCAEAGATVEAGAYASVTISCDTGIR